MATTASVFSPTLPVLAESFKRSLLAENKSPKAIKAYLEALRMFDGFLAAHSMPHEAGTIKRDHVEAFIADQPDALEACDGE